MKTRPRSAHPLFAPFVLLALLTTLGISACEPRATDNNSGDAQQPHNTVSIKGNLAPAVGNGANAQVIVFRVQSDGTLQNITVGDSQTDTKGSFEVLADVGESPISNVILEARSSVEPRSDKNTDKNTDNKTAEMPTRLASALLVSQLKPGGAVTTAPLNFETTLQADLYVQARKLALWDDAQFDQAQLRIAVTPQITTALRESGDYNAQVAILARAITAGMRAFSDTLHRTPVFEDIITREDHHEIEPGYRGGEAQKEFSKEDIQKARKDFRSDVEKYDRRLDSQNGEPTNDRERGELNNAVVQSYMDNDINIHVLTNANQAASEATLTVLPQLAPTARAAVMSNVEVLRARYITRAIQADFSTLGGPGESSKAVEQAGVTLRSQLAALADRSDDISNDVHSLWQQYRQRVEEKLQTTFTAQQRQVVEQMQSNITPATRTMFSTLENLHPDTTPTEDIASTAADAVLLFRKDTITLAYSDLWKDADINGNRANAILDILLNFATIR